MGAHIRKRSQLSAKVANLNRNTGNLYGQKVAITTELGCRSHQVPGTAQQVKIALVRWLALQGELLWPAACWRPYSSLLLVAVSSSLERAVRSKVCTTSYCVK